MANIPTLQELKDQAISDIESKVGRSAPLLPISFWEILATAMAGLAYGIYKFGQWVRRQIFVATADEDALLARGLEYGLQPTPATFFTFIVNATGINGRIINEGEILTFANKTYVTLETKGIDSGSASIQCEATEAGSGSNLSVSDVLEFATRITDIATEATVTSIIQSGSDSEDLENFRARVTFRQQLPPQGGAVPDYVQWATEVSGIAEAYPFRISPNYINVYTITSDPLNRIPDAPKLAEVQAYLNDPKRKPMSDNVTAAIFSEVGIVVEISNLVPNDVALQNSIQEGVVDYLLSRRPRLFPDEADAPNIISSSDITTIASLLGARSLGVSLEFVDTTPFTNYTLEDDELAILDSITFV